MKCFTTKKWKWEPLPRAAVSQISTYQFNKILHIWHRLPMEKLDHLIRRTLSLFLSYSTLKISLPQISLHYLFYVQVQKFLTSSKNQISLKLKKLTVNCKELLLRLLKRVKRCASYSWPSSTVWMFLFIGKSVFFKQAFKIYASKAFCRI